MKTPAQGRASRGDRGWSISTHRLPRTYERPEVSGEINYRIRRRGLLDDLAGPRGIDLDPGTHRRRGRDRAQVAALRRRRLGADQFFDHRRVVLEQRPLGEVTLADHQVHDRVAVSPVL